MLWHYFKIVFRNFKKNKSHSLINIGGLAIGLAGFIIIILYVNYQYSYDNWNKKLNRVYRIGFNIKESDGEDNKTVDSPYPFGTEILNSCPEVQSVTRVIEAPEEIITYNEHSFYDKQIIFADSSFFKIFPYVFIYGNSTNALNNPNSVVITKTISEKLFGNTNPVGKIIRIENRLNSRLCAVSGVIKKTGPSHLNFNFCISYFNNQPNNWGRQFYITYTLLKKKTSLPQFTVEAKKIYINGIVDYINNSIQNDDTVKNISHLSLQKILLNQGIRDISLIPESVHKIHLQPQCFASNGIMGYDLINDYAIGNLTPVITLSIAALLILILACINYTNLSIAQATKRAKEIGLSKVFGVKRVHLIFQFLFETFMQCLLSLIIAILIVEILLPLFNENFNLNLSLFNIHNIAKNGYLFKQIISILLLTTLFSGGYPAYFLSSYQPSKVLNGDLLRGIAGKRLRNALILIQFIISISFISGMLIIYYQIRFMHKKDLGFDLDQVLAIQPVNPKILNSKHSLQFLKNSLLKIPGVQEVAAADAYPGNAVSNIQEAYFNGDSTTLNYMYVDFDYFKMFNMKILEGRDFSKKYTNDTINSAVLNEAAVRKLGLKEPIGQVINVLLTNYHIVGVLQNDYIDGFTTSIEPTIYTVSSNLIPLQYDYFLVKLRGENVENSVNKITQMWREIEPEFPIRYSWVDKDFAHLIFKFEKLEKLFAVFTLISIIIAAMGIFALSAFTVEQKAKEVSIRKTLGAGTYDLLKYFIKDFALLVIIANVIALPITIIFGVEWLNNFAYRINFPVIPFIIAAVLSISLTIGIVSTQVFKTIKSNLIKNLHYE